MEKMKLSFIDSGLLHTGLTGYSYFFFIDIDSSKVKSTF